MDYKKQLIGKRSKRKGEMWETGLDHIFSRLAQRGIAFIQKTPEPLRVISRTSKGNVFNAVFTAKAQPDYTGTLYGGRSVMLEAKCTESDRITADRILDSQAAYLDRHAALGAVCGILVCIQFDTYGFIPWHEWKDLKNICGHKYVNAADLQAHGWELKGDDITHALAVKLNSQICGD